MTTESAALDEFLADETGTVLPPDGNLFGEPRPTLASFIRRGHQKATARQLTSDEIMSYGGVPTVGTVADGGTVIWNADAAKVDVDKAFDDAFGLVPLPVKKRVERVIPDFPASTYRFLTR